MNIARKPARYNFARSWRQSMQTPHRTYSARCFFTAASFEPGFLFDKMKVERELTDAFNHKS
jgi:hypothetical protein